MLMSFLTSIFECGSLFNKELINLFAVVSVLPLLTNVIRLPNSSKKQTNTGY